MTKCKKINKFFFFSIYINIDTSKKYLEYLQIFWKLGWFNIYMIDIELKF